MGVGDTNAKTKGETPKISLLSTIRLLTESTESNTATPPGYILGRFKLSLAMAVFGFSTSDPNNLAVLLLS